MLRTLNLVIDDESNPLYYSIFGKGRNKSEAHKEHVSKLNNFQLMLLEEGAVTDYVEVSVIHTDFYKLKSSLNPSDFDFKGIIRSYSPGREPDEISGFSDYELRDCYDFTHIRTSVILLTTQQMQALERNRIRHGRLTR